MNDQADAGLQELLVSGGHHRRHRDHAQDPQEPASLRRIAHSIVPKTTSSVSEICDKTD